MTDKISKNKLIIKDISEQQAYSIKNEGLLFVGIMLEKTSESVINAQRNTHQLNKPINTEGIVLTEETPTTITIETDAPIATSVTEDMDFEMALSTAKDEVGNGGFFEWKGQSYITTTREEWDAMGSEEQATYSENIFQQMDFSSVTTVEESSVLNIMDIDGLNQTPLENAASEEQYIEINLEEINFVDEVIVEDADEVIDAIVVEAEAETIIGDFDSDVEIDLDNLIIDESDLDIVIELNESDVFDFSDMSSSFEQEDIVDLEDYINVDLEGDIDLDADLDMDDMIDLDIV